MSQRTWTVTGYGILESDVCKGDVFKKLDFLLMYDNDMYEKIMARSNDIISSDENITEEDYEQVYEQVIDDYEDDYCHRGFLPMFVEALNKNVYNVSFVCHQGEYEHENCIMFESGLPWQWSRNERRLTPKKMDKIYGKYMKVLGVKDYSVDYLSVEYYG